MNQSVSIHKTPTTLNTSHAQEVLEHQNKPKSQNLSISLLSHLESQQNDHLKEYLEVFKKKSIQGCLSYIIKFSSLFSQMQEASGAAKELKRQEDEGIFYDVQSLFQKLNKKLQQLCEETLGKVQDLFKDSNDLSFLEDYHQIIQDVGTLELSWSDAIQVMKDLIDKESYQQDKSRVQQQKQNQSTYGDSTYREETLFKQQIIDMDQSSKYINQQFFIKDIGKLEDSILADNKQLIKELEQSQAKQVTPESQNILNLPSLGSQMYNLNISVVQQSQPQQVDCLEDEYDYGLKKDIEKDLTKVQSKENKQKDPSIQKPKKQKFDKKQNKKEENQENDESYYQKKEEDFEVKKKDKRSVSRQAIFNKKTQNKKENFNRIDNNPKKDARQDTTNKERQFIQKEKPHQAKGPQFTQLHKKAKEFNDDALKITHEALPAIIEKSDKSYISISDNRIKQYQALSADFEQLITCKVFENTEKMSEDKQQSFRRINTKKPKFLKYFQQSQSSNCIASFEELLYVGFYNGKLCEVDLHKDQVTEMGKHVLPWYSIACEKSNRIWLTDKKNQLYKIDPHAKQPDFELVQYNNQKVKQLQGKMIVISTDKDFLFWKKANNTISVYDLTIKEVSKSVQYINLKLDPNDNIAGFQNSNTEADKLFILTKQGATHIYLKNRKYKFGKFEDKYSFLTVYESQQKAMYTSIASIQDNFFIGYLSQVNQIKSKFINLKVLQIQDSEEQNSFVSNQYKHKANITKNVEKKKQYGGDIKLQQLQNHQFKYISDDEVLIPLQIKAVLLGNVPLLMMFTNYCVHLFQGAQAGSFGNTTYLQTTCLHTCKVYQFLMIYYQLLFFKRRLVDYWFLIQFRKDDRPVFSASRGQSQSFVDRKRPCNVVDEDLFAQLVSFL